MEKFNQLVPLLAELKKKGSVSKEDHDKATSLFRILGECWVSDLSEEAKAFDEISKTYFQGGKFKEELW